MNKSGSTIIEINEEKIKEHIGTFVKQTIEETLNALLDAEADELCRAQRYERSPDRQDYRAGHYTRQLHTTAGEVTLRVPKLRRLPFESSIIERYRRRESSTEEAMIEMYLAGVSVRRIEDITEALWGTKVSPGTISALNKKIYAHIEEWRNRPIEKEYPYVYLDGIALKRSWGGEVRTISVLVAIGVTADGFRDIIGVAEGAKEDKEGWSRFMSYLKQRGLRGVRVFISDKNIGLIESLHEYYPEARWQRCVVHFYRNVFTMVPSGKVKTVSAMLKAIHAQESLEAAREKARAVVEKLREMKLAKAAQMVQEGIEETLTYMRFPSEHWRRLRTNNPLERVLREVRRRTRVVGAFPDGESALMLVAARLRYVASHRWGEARYMNMDLLFEREKEIA